MELESSGSLDTAISSIHFMKSGDVLVTPIKDESLTDSDISSLLWTQEFIFYAIEREDWLQEFINIAKSKKQNDINQTPNLVLLQGGISDEEEK